VLLKPPLGVLEEPEEQRGNRQVVALSHRPHVFALAFADADVQEARLGRASTQRRGGHALDGAGEDGGRVLLRNGGEDRCRVVGHGHEV
jgi:hypothetical protein